MHLVPCYFMAATCCRTAPIWGGLVINTVFYGFVWFMLLIGIGFVHRLRTHPTRTAAADCPRCAHDLRGDLDAGCSECGWERDCETQIADAGDSA